MGKTAEGNTVLNLSSNTLQVKIIHAPSASLSFIESMLCQYEVCLCRHRCCLRRASVSYRISSPASLRMKKLRAQTTRMDLSS